MGVLQAVDEPDAKAAKAVKAAKAQVTELCDAEYLGLAKERHQSAHDFVEAL